MAPSVVRWSGYLNGVGHWTACRITRGGPIMPMADPMFDQRMMVIVMQRE